MGGIIAYILVSGDPGYSASVQHGLIAAVDDQSDGAMWSILSNIEIEVPGTSTSLGSGSVNTDYIIAQNGTKWPYAAGIARAYDGGGYTDWYLPSGEELNKLDESKYIIGGFTASSYWSSSGSGSEYALVHRFGTSSQFGTSKSSEGRVRAVRSF